MGGGGPHPTAYTTFPHPSLLSLACTLITATPATRSPPCSLKVLVSKDTGRTISGLLVAYLHLLGRVSSGSLHEHTGASGKHARCHFLSLAPSVQGRITQRN
jgi:hypothetical protein